MQKGTGVTLCAIKCLNLSMRKFIRLFLFIRFILLLGTTILLINDVPSDSVYPRISEFIDGTLN